MREPWKLPENLRIFLHRLCLVVFVLSVTGLLGYSLSRLGQNKSSQETKKELQSIRQSTKKVTSYGKGLQESTLPTAGIEAVLTEICRDTKPEKENIKAPEILAKYQSLYEINSDLAGWLIIDDTVVDYPVMQTPEDENHYLQLDFYGNPNKNGCLILDTDSNAGTGTKAFDYQDGTAPSTNLIIHGHTMKSGEMFGNLKYYTQEDYGKEHSRIRFDTLYEEREYELIAVFYSAVYYEADEVFKYYKFFQADTGEEFEDWYTNIKALSLYDTGVTAQFGDEFITLSCCSYHEEDGRLVVVGKRIR